MSVFFAVFIAPFLLAAFFPETPVFYAYAEKMLGFWSVFESIDRMRFERIQRDRLEPGRQPLAPNLVLRSPKLIRSTDQWRELSREWKSRII